ncbi:hypothetical protein D5086_004607 [Populus alba]|uniref:Uncharacterized protein n=1 Tax=Populus alba TaxID=43335 RepID=A0ACC4CQY8_POPAL
MNVSASEYSGGGGCESGWTSYLNQSSNSKHQYQAGFGGFVDGDYARVEEDQEEDLSMVSDASSGPPQYCEDDGYGCDKLAKKSRSKKKSKEHGRSKQHSYLDDSTASSPAGNPHSRSTLDSFNPLILIRQLQKNQVIVRQENGNDKF